MENVYHPPVVKALRAFYGPILFTMDQYPTIKDHLEALSKRMLIGVQQRQPFVYTEISNYHKQHLGKSTEALLEIPFGIEDCKTAIANSYGFDDWAQVETLCQVPYHSDFEQAVNALVEGRFDDLKAIAAKDSAIVNQRSQYGHKATLLHYAGSNGIELWRQMVPSNLPEITAFLIEKGADKNATMMVYGGNYDTLALMESSSHPFEAGIADALRAVLA